MLTNNLLPVLLRTVATIRIQCHDAYMHSAKSINYTEIIEIKTSVNCFFKQLLGNFWVFESL